MEIILLIGVLAAGWCCYWVGKEKGKEEMRDIERMNTSAEKARALTADNLYLQGMMPLMEEIEK